MFKRLLKIGMFACAMTLACNVFAQGEKTYAPEYPHYGFWSNWSIGGELGYGRSASNGWGWTHGSNAGFNFIIEKELNHVWDFRMKIGMPGVFGHGDSTVFAHDFTTDSCQSLGFDRYMTSTVGFKFSINNAIKGYDPNRKGNWYLLADGGAAYGVDKANVGGQNVHAGMTLVADLGMGYSRKCGEHSTWFVEGILDDKTDIPNIFKTRHNLCAFLGLGYMYNFGPTATDLEMIAQKALLTQENIDNLNNQIAALEQEVANSKKAEQRLENKISELENQMATMHKGGSSADADSLQNIINNMKADQLNYYALPFSILYGVDEYKIPADQKEKVKAVARIMKDNDNINFSIVGFCDHTGSDAYNMKLSQKRAETVKDELVNKYGIDEDRLSCDWKGKNNPFADTKLSINRRVSFYRVIE